MTAFDPQKLSMEIKSISPNGIKFLVKEEGMILHPYLDAVGIPTIGVGCTYYTDGTRVKMTDPPITEEDAILLFRNVLKHYETTVWSSTRDDINQNQFDALVSLCFNIGAGALKSSTVLKRVNKDPSDPLIHDAFLMWKNAGGKPILLKRRKRESALYFS
jgi:lysozyme